LLNPAYSVEASYSLALIELDEGPWMLTNIGCPPDEARVGMEVAVTFEQCGPDIMLPKFKTCTVVAAHCGMPETRIS